MRAPIIILVLSNLAFAAWALLIDQPVGPPAARDISRLPTLEMASEPVPGEAVAGNSAKDAAAGPTTTGAATASSLLHNRGFTPRQRDEPGQDLVAYWVYLDNVPSDAAATRLLQKLHSSGLADARVMPIASDTETRRISVGLFNEQAGADRRARQVKGMGLTPAITEQRTPQASYWVNINLTTPEQSVSTEGLLPPAAEGAHLEIRDCPAALSSAPAPVASHPK
jgi:hypothetical protein